VKESAVDQVAGSAIPLRGDNIDTDRIIPARYLKAVTFDGLGDHVFEDDRSSMPKHPFSNPSFRQATILLANRNFGSGSSREHAPQALKRWGIHACIAESFSEIFRGNSLAIGLPCFTASHVDIEFAMRCVEESPGTHLSVSVSDRVLLILDKTLTLEIPDGMRDALLKGQWDPTEMLLDRFDQVRATAADLPYVVGF
jgi:3-isopropylmalate/(R)-2-methylmalate dehydratase small subunit